MAPFGPWPGESGGGFLAPIYAAGLADNPDVDNLFGMPSGNLRFPGSIGSLQFPNAAYFESATTPGDARVPAWYTRRYYNTAARIGDVLGDGFVGYDPLWDGTFASLQNLEITSELIGFTSDSGQTSFPGGFSYATLARQDYLSNSGFFDGPQAYPTPGFNSGSREDLNLSLWNGFTGGLFTHPSHSFNGWGQHTTNTISTTTGVITAALNLSWWSGVSPVAGDGLGIFFTLGTDDPPKGLISNTVLTSDVHGLYRLGFYTASATNTLGSPIATMDWTNGAQFNSSSNFNGAVNVKPSATLTTVQTPIVIGGPTGIPAGVFNMVAGSFSSANSQTKNLVLANDNGGNLAGTGFVMFAGSNDGSVGSQLIFFLNGPGATGNNGPGAMNFDFYSPVNAPMYFWNQSGGAGGDIKFGTNFPFTESFRATNDGHLQTGATGIQAPGATAVAITNSPGANPTPTEYWVVKNALGQIRYIPLLS
jgi:hypothetical protein